jgi:hypothetical protein
MEQISRTYVKGRSRPVAACRGLQKRTFADFDVRPVAVGQRRRPNCPEAVIRLASVSLASAGEAQLFALRELGGWESPEWSGIMRTSPRIIWRPMRNASVLDAETRGRTFLRATTEKVFSYSRFVS